MRPFTVLCALLIAASASAAIPTSEREALLAIYNATNGPGWTQKTNWGGAPGSECTWHGVNCDETQSNVLDLELYDNNLDGTLPAAIGSFPKLRSMQLYQNNLRGTMPPEIGNLAELQLLILQNNHFTGTIPPQWSALKKLARLHVDGNELTGPLPNQLTDLTALEELTMSYNAIEGTIPDLSKLTELRQFEASVNRFTGNVPASFGSLPHIEWIGLVDNRLDGSIPPELGNATTLVELRLAYNRLIGPIPASFGRLHSLERLHLNNNQLGGEIPAEIGDMAAMKYLDLTTNGFEGSLPSAFFRLTNLEELGLGDNDFSGSIPLQIGNLAKLQVLGLYANDLTGSIPIEITTIAPLRSLELQSNDLGGTIPPELSRLTNLTWIDLSGNALTGNVPRELATLANLQVLQLYENSLEGLIPSELGQLTNLQILSLGSNRFHGGIPDALRNLTKLNQLYLNGNTLTGPVPSWIGELTLLSDLFLDYNQLSGPLPPGLSTLSNLTYLSLGENQLTGNLPDFNGLPNLRYIYIGFNQFSGPLPASIGTLANLVDAYLGNNQLSGPLPKELGDLANLEYLDLANNSFEGTIPPQLGQLKKVYALGLSGNRFTGTIPPQLGDMSGLLYLDLSFNGLKGPIPVEITKLTTLENNRSDFAFNALYTNDEAVRAFVNSKHYTGNFAETQTITPTNFRLVSTTDRSATLSWSPIEFFYFDGGYQVVATTSPGGAAVAVATTGNKQDDSITMRNLVASTSYFFTVSAVTHPHAYNKNLLISEPTAPVQGQTTQRVNAPAEVVITDQPNGIVQIDRVEVATDSFTLTNFGDTATTISLERTEDFFTIEPQQFQLAGGASQIVTIRSLPRDAGTYNGYVGVHGDGIVGEGIAYVVLLSTTRPAGTVIATPVASRIELVGIPGSDEVGTVQFRNTGTAQLTGILVSDQPWVEVPTERITIDPGTTGTVSIRVVRSKRPNVLEGALVANVSLIYVSGGESSHISTHDTSTVSVSKVTIVDTTKPPTAPGSLPPLAPGQIPFFIPGVASTPSIESHLSVINAAGATAISDLKLYFTKGAQTTIASLQPLGFTQSINLVNLVNSVYGNTDSTGTLQIRSGKWSDLSSSAKVTAVSGAATYTGAIPIFRGDRSIGVGSRLYLTGLAAPGDVFVQDTGGGNASVHTEFRDASGNTVGARDDMLAPFGLLELSNAIPANAATAIIANVSGGSTITAYARLRNASGDTWSIVDWSRFYGYVRGQSVRIPFADGAQPGGGGTKRRSVRTTATTPSSRTDVVIYNPGTSEERATIQIIESSGNVIERSVMVPAGATVTTQDAAQPATSPVAHIVVTPVHGNDLVVTARSIGATGGSAIPVVSATAGLRLGQSQLFSSLDDSAATRTAYGFTESSGATVKVRARIVIDSASQLVAISTTRTFTLAPREQVYLPELVKSFAGDARNTLFGDLHNLTLEVEVIEGSGSVVPFVIATDTASGDTTMIVQ